MPHARSLGIAVGLGIGLAAFQAGAQAPPNDTWNARQPISSLPFADTKTNLVHATLDPGEPSLSCAVSRYQTVWYSYIVAGPSPEYLGFETSGSTYDTVLAIFTGAPGGFRPVYEACNDDGAPGETSRVSGVRLDPGVEYSIMVASYSDLCCDGEILSFAAATAAVHQVTKTADTLDGSCDADCSLREALAAHDATSGVVLVPPGTYALTAGPLDVSLGGSIYGAGAGVTIFDGLGTHRVVTVSPPGPTWPTIALVDLTLTHGLGSAGGALATYVFSRTVLVGLDVLDSQATSDGGGVQFGGSGVVSGSRVMRNSAAGAGGGINVTGRPVNVFDSTIAQNQAADHGGGVNVIQPAGIVITLRMTNVTVSGNQSSIGGGISLGQDLSLSNVSVVGNHAGLGAGIHINAGIANLNNSLFAHNTLNGTSTEMDCSALGGVFQGSYNVFQDLVGCSIGGLNENNVNGVDVRVSPILASNGAATLTHALLPGSPAIDSGSATCGDLLVGGPAAGPTFDQRGRERAVDGNGDGVARCDRGAYELTRVKGDFDGDRRTDLLFRATGTDSYSAWLMNGTARWLESPVTPDPVFGWRVAGVDDFNGDDRNDLVLRNQSTGDVQFWPLNGTDLQGVSVPITNAPVLDAAWTLAATADFNRDARPDLLWRNDVTQKIAVWTMAGSERLETLVPSPDQAVDANWAVVAARDWDGNGTTDLLWYNSTTGKIVQWLMNDAVQRTSGRFTTPPNAGDNNWKVVAGGDYGIGPGGQPGTADIVWRNETSGRLVAWYLDWSGQRTSGVFTSPDAPEPPLTWEVVGPR